MHPRMIGRTSGLALVTLLLAGAAQAQAPAAAPTVPPTIAKVRESGSITLAYREASIPFSYLDQNKRPIGYAMDLCMRVVESLIRL